MSDAVRAIPLGTRQLIATSLDLLTRTDAGFRSASFYIGLMLLLAVGPMVALFVVVWVTLGEAAFESTAEPGPWVGWLVLAALPAFLGYLAASVDARALATAVIGGRVEGRPLRLRESIAIVRRRFWRVLGGQAVAGLAVLTVSFVVSFVVALTIGSVEAVDFGVSLVVALVVGAPFVYVPAGIILGEAGITDAVRGSFRLVRARPRLAVVVTVFGVLSQYLVLLGLGVGLDAVFRVVAGVGLDDAFPPALVVPMAAALVFAMGTLVFLVEAIAAAPAVHAFAALTYYTNGLELGRREPLRAARPWQPYLTPGLAVGALVGLAALVFGILSL